MELKKLSRYIFPLLPLFVMLSGTTAVTSYGNVIAKNIKHFDIENVNNLSRISTFDFTGNLIKAVSWRDLSGENILLFTEQKSVAAEPDGPVDSHYSKFEIFVYHYFETDGILRLQRQIYDYMSGCRIKPESGFDFDSLNITDIDNNGIGEVSFVYRLLCGEGNYSGSQIKLMMLENGQKFALRGEGRMQTRSTLNSQSSTKAGKSWKYVADDTYEQAPPDFLHFSRMCWNEYGKPTPQHHH